MEKELPKTKEVIVQNVYSSNSIQVPHKIRDIKFRPYQRKGFPEPNLPYID